MNATEQVISSILGKMGKHINKNQLMILNQVLISEFINKDIIPQNNPIVVYEGESEKLISQFLTIKTIDGCSNQTINTYSFHLHKLIEIIDTKSVLNMTANDIRGFLAFYKNHRKVSNVTLNNMRHSMSSFFKYLHEEGYIKENPMRQISSIKTKQTIKKPFSDEDVAQMCASLGVSDVPFKIDEDVLLWQKNVSNKGEIEEQKWQQKVEQLKENNKELYNEIFAPKFNINKTLNEIKFKEALATRDAGKTVLNKLANTVPNLIGGSADLVGATKTYIDNSSYYSATNRIGRNIAFGVREHSMAAIANGIALHKGLKPFVSTFLVFSDYCRYAIRMSALMNLPVLYIWTHDSLAVGEDGATHQPIEQLESLRLIPNHCVIRPADAEETKGAYKIAMQENCPVSVVLSRQTLPILKSSSANNVEYGGYVISEEQNPKKLELVLIATGSEVSLCINVQQELEKQGHSVRVVSMPCKELFFKQDKTYQNKVLPKKCVKRISVEAGVTSGWAKIVGDNGVAIGVNQFGESGKGQEVMELFGFDVKNIVKIAKKLLK